MTLAKDDLIRLAEVARRSGVPPATVKHYVRAGLLPGPSRRTGRTMAYYHPSLVSRVKAIKELQEKRHLPLAVIRNVLDGADPYSTEETEAALTAALARKETPESRTRAELLESGMPAEQLDFFEAVGFVTPRGRGKARRYEGDDLALLRTLAAARRAGLSPEMLPHTIVAPYLEAIDRLARAELELFRAGLEKREAGRSVEELVASAAELSERLVVLLRRKRLLPNLRALMKEERDAGKRRPPRRER